MYMEKDLIVNNRRLLLELMAIKEKLRVAKFILNGSRSIEELSLTIFKLLLISIPLSSNFNLIIEAVKAVA